MRLSGPIFEKADDPAVFIAAHARAGYSAVAWPPYAREDPRLGDFLVLAKRANLPIAEVGAWSNPISQDRPEADKAIAKCIDCLAFADHVGALCCVNIAGSRGKQWDGPDPDNTSKQTFDLIVATVRQIIDAVKPTRSCYSLETMPWVFPDSPDSYLALFKAIDRKQFAVHLDPVNMINCPQRAYHTGDFIRECFKKLGPHIKSCHAKDITLGGKLTVHLDECGPGQGILDYRAYLTELAKLHPDTPLVMEHLTTAGEYAAAAAHIRKVAKEEGVTIQ